MTAATTNTTSSEATRPQQPQRSELSRQSNAAPHGLELFGDVFSRSLDASKLRQHASFAARGERLQAQVSPLGPQAADKLAHSAAHRQTATDAAAQRDLQARRERLSDQPRLSERLAEAQQRQQRAGRSDVAAATEPTRAAARSAPAQQASQPGQGGDARATSNPSGQPANAQTNSGNAGNHGNGTNTTGGDAAPNSTGKGAGAPAGNALAAGNGAANGRAAAPTAARGGAVQSVSAAGATTAKAGAAQTGSANFSEALQGAKAPRANAARAAARGEGAQRQAPAENKPFVQQVSRGLFATVRQNGGSLTMRLNPASLGQLKIHMTIQGNAVTADITAATEPAQQMLSDNLAGLRAALESKGLTVNQITITQAPQIAANHVHTAGQQGAEQQGSSADHAESGGQDANADDRHAAGEGGSTGGEDDQAREQQGGGSFTWHIPVPGDSAERTTINGQHAVSALNVVA
jgi:flagellar hook-length control protein FliK